MINSPSPRPVCHQVFPTLPSKCSLNSVIPSHSLIQAFTTLSVCHDKPLSFSHILTFQAISIEHLPFSSYYSLAQEFLTLCCFWSKQTLSLHSLDWLGNAAAAAAKSLQSCPTLCDPIDGSPPGFPVPGILQAKTLEWVAISFSNAWKWKVKVSDPMDCSLPGSSIHGIFQAKVLEWGAIAFSVVMLVCYC